MANENLILKILTSLFKVFCGGSSSGHDNQQNQYGSYPQQQQQQQQQYNQQQQGYPGQYPPQPQQQQYPPQQSWSQVAGGSSPQHYQNQNQNHQHHQNQNHQQHKPNGQYPHQNGNHYSKPALPAGGIVGPHHPHQNQDQINATNEKYQQLRNQARHEGDEAHKCFAASQNAYKSGDGGRAHDLSVQGKQHQKRQDDLDDEAASWIFNENNKNSPPNTIDLHGLYVKEAIERVEAAVAEGQRTNQDELRVIVGKGIHSQGHVAKIKPAVQDLMQRYNLYAYIDPHNTGVLVVDIDGNERQGRTRDAGGLVDQMDREQGGDCVIM